MKKLRLCLIGSCGRGTLADLAHDPASGVEVVAGADISEELLASFQRRYREKFAYSARAYPDYREMIRQEKPDGVFITSPDFCHEEQAIYALKKGVPVYLEKPMAITLEGCDRIMEAARDSGTIVMVGHNMRYMNFTRKMKEIIESGLIGRVCAVWCRHFISYGGDAYFRDWHAERRFSNSLLLQKGAHDIDIIHWLAGSRTVRVSGFGALSVYGDLPRRREGERVPRAAERVSVDNWPPPEQAGFNPRIDVEDTNMIIMRLANGVLASYLQSHYTPDSRRNYTVIGTRGRLENYDDNEKGPTVEAWTRRTDKCNLRGDVTWRTPPETGGHGGADPMAVKDFISMLRGERITGATLQDARYSVAAGCGGASSARSGGEPVDIPELPPRLESYDFSVPRVP